MHNSILRQIHLGVEELSDVLNSLASQAEMLHPGMLCSILLFDAEANRLHHVAAPSLPSQFVREIDGMLASEEASSSAYAASSGKRVIVENMSRSPECSMSRARVLHRYCQHATAAGFQSCWSQPIKGREKRVLGVFAIYQRAPARPGDEDIRLLESCANLARAGDRTLSGRGKESAIWRFSTCSRSYPTVACSSTACVRPWPTAEEAGATVR